MLGKIPFKLYKRTLKSGKKVFYVRFLLPDSKYTDGRSTGELTKRKAELKAWDYIKKGNPTSLQNLKPKEYSKKFFDWNGEWALSKRSAGRRLSEEQCNRNNSLLTMHVSSFVNSVKQHFEGKVAIVGNGELFYDMFELFSRFTSSENFNSKIFRDPDEALAWIAN